jgi:hypothetical protein
VKRAAIAIAIVALARAPAAAHADCRIEPGIFSGVALVGGVDVSRFTEGVRTDPNGPFMYGWSVEVGANLERWRPGWSFTRLGAVARVDVPIAHRWHVRPRIAYEPASWNDSVDSLIYAGVRAGRGMIVFGIDAFQSSHPD